jgi:hypothetical protein
MVQSDQLLVQSDQLFWFIWKYFGRSNLLHVIKHVTAHLDNPLLIKLIEED